jgi:hypothetical protein
MGEFSKKVLSSIAVAVITAYAAPEIKRRLDLAIDAWKNTSEK